MKKSQAGLTLIEVLVALVIMCVGLLGAAALQINALKYTDSSSMSSQASFIAYDMMDRIRANSANTANYALTALSSKPSQGSSTVAATQDLYDFGTNVTNMGGTDASIVPTGYNVKITIVWSDARAANTVKADGSTNTTNASRSFVLTSRVAVDAVTQ